MALTTTIDMPVTAKLMLVPEFGEPREATPADIRAIGFVHQSDLYMAADYALTRIMGVTDDDRMDLTRWRDGDTVANLVRYFIDVVINYHHLGGDTYPANYEEMGDRIIAHFTQDDGDGNYGERLRFALGGAHRDEHAGLTIGQRVEWNDDSSPTGRVVSTGVIVAFNNEWDGETLVAVDGDGWKVMHIDNLNAAA